MSEAGEVELAATERESGLTTASLEPAVPWQPFNPDTDKLLSPASKVVPILGAGLSAGAGLPGCAELGQRLRDDFNAPDSTHPDPRVVATDIINRGLATDRDVQESVACLFTESRGRLKPTAALNAIANIPSRWVVTLNYDDSVEQVAAQLGVEARAYTWKALPPWDDVDGDAPHPLNVLHLHGRWQDPDTIILDRRTYARTIENDDTVKAFLSPLLKHHNACFIGTSFDEAYLVNFFAALPINEPKHVFFIQTSDVNSIRDGRLSVTTEAQNVIYEPFLDGDWAALDLLCQRYFEPSGQLYPTLAASDFVVPAPVPLYVAPVLVRLSRGVQRTAQALAASIELGQEEAIGTDTLAVKSRTFIIGRPGSGKSELLRKAAAEVPGDERAVYIRLSSVSDPIGNPVAVLVGWTHASQPLNAERQLTAEDLDGQRFHFLLDGLDEVGSARQARLATRITDMARALPQHRFTVTARPVPAADSFDPSEWDLLELTTTVDWRRGYLKLAEVTEEALVAAVPALSDLDELLNLPFFLATVVDLYKKHALPADGDLMAVIRALIDEALSGSEITPVRDAVRPWLRDVAFAIQAAGRSSLSREELSRVALPAGLNLGPDDDVVDLLTRRSLLEVVGSDVRFVHRLVGDALTAEKLISLGPDTPGLLDMVVPATAEAMGARSDWMVVLAFAGSVSADWRAAVSRRDPLAAARMVPPTADVQERRKAAQALWRDYVSSRVWMHYAGGTRLLRDDEVVGRLLHAGDLSDVVDEILGGTHNPSPQVRSNTIDVLAAGRLDNVLEPLVRAALAGEPEEVVRRQAAGDAAQCNLVSAFPLIRHRALTSGEDLEVQAMVAVGLRLAPLDQLVEFALALIDAQRTQFFAVASVVHDRLGADAALTVMRKQVERDEPSHLRDRMLKELNDELPDTDDAAEKLAFIVAFGRGRDIVIGRLLAHPDATMRGLVAALHRRPRRWFDVAPLAAQLPQEVFDSVEFEDEELRELLRRFRTPIATGSTGEPTAEPEAPVQGEPEPEEPRDATLVELLDRYDDEAEFLLTRRALNLAPQVKILDVTRQRRLRRRVRGWWPEVGFAPSKTENSITWEAHACLAYGGQLNLPLTDSEWGEVAQVRMPYEGKIEWLQRRYRRNAAVLAARNLQATTAEPWAHLSDAVPGDLPPTVVDAIAVHVRIADLFLRQILTRLIAEGRIEALRKLAAVQGAVGDAAVYFVAQAGDVRAQRRCLATLNQEFGTDKQIHSGDLSWTQGISDEVLLPELLNALVSAYHHRNPDYNDAMTPIHEAIRRIGGVKAIRGYNELMAQEPPAFSGVQFVRYHRDNVVDDLLRAAGDQVRPQLLARLALPAL